MNNENENENNITLNILNTITSHDRRASILAEARAKRKPTVISNKELMEKLEDIQTAQRSLSTNLMTRSRSTSIQSRLMAQSTLSPPNEINRSLTPYPTPLSLEMKSPRKTYTVATVVESKNGHPHEVDIKDVLPTPKRTNHRNTIHNIPSSSKRRGLEPTPDKSRPIKYRKISPGEENIPIATILARPSKLVPPTKVPIYCKENIAPKKSEYGPKSFPRRIPLSIRNMNTTSGSSSSLSKSKKVLPRPLNPQSRLLAPANTSNVLLTKLRDLEKERDDLKAKLNEVSAHSDRQVELYRDSVNRKVEQMAQLDKEKVALQNQNKQLTSQLQKSQEEINQVEKIKKHRDALKEEVRSLRDEKMFLEEKMQQTKESLDARMNEVMKLTNDLQQLHHELMDRDQRLSEKSKEVEHITSANRNLEQVRRNLHNQILELKGNIRVFCRVRPITKPDAISCIDVPNDEGKLVLLGSNRTTIGDEIQNKTPFKFDKVFPPGTTNSVVFEEIEQLVQSALDGYRVCIFAYGQTGSGKTHTMEGPQSQTRSSDVAGDDRGMIPRAVHKIFQCSQELLSQGWVFNLTAQFVEIYNEQIRDLLAEVPTRDSRSLEPKTAQVKYEIKHDGNNTIITNVKVVPVHNSDTVSQLLAKASQNRASAATNCNERSSRSHSVFTLHIKGSNEKSKQDVNGVLNLIDLAGSERLAISGATGDRQKETQHINTSLSCLGNVISALASKQSHIPFRNSKLTYLLQNCLGGDCKTLMFVNVSPLPEHSSETLCSLRFASKVNTCENGPARRALTIRD